MAGIEKDNAKIAKECYDLFSRGDMTKLGEMFAENATLLSVPTNETFRGRANVAGYIGNFKTAFPDMTITVQHQVACGDEVVTEFVGRGTHKGVFHTNTMGDIAPTNHKVDLPLCEILRIKDGRLTQSHLYFDAASLMNQLGLMGHIEEHRTY
jgi:steroid delta-isomerase-like uncharacterized protein